MSLQNRIEELNRRHAKLDAEIAQEQKRPAYDETTVRSLKQKKLKIKEEIGLLRTG